MDNFSKKKTCDKVSSHTPGISRQRQTTNNCEMDMNGGKQKEEKQASGSPKSRKVTTSPQFVSVYVTRKICIIDIYQRVLLGSLWKGKYRSNTGQGEKFSYDKALKMASVMSPGRFQSWNGLSALLQDCVSPLRMSKLQEMVKDQNPSMLQSMGSQRVRHD